MAGGQIGNISKSTYLSATDEIQKELIFDALEAIYDKQCSQPGFCQERWDQCNKRMKKIENRKFTDKTFAGMMGLIGGFVASLIKRF